MYKRTIFRLVLAIAIAIGIILGVWQMRPPAANEDCPHFQRMMYNIERWSPRPRHGGTDAARAEIARVRAGIIAEIEEMGLEAIIHEVVYTRDEVAAARQLLAGRRTINDRYFRGDRLYLQNILVRLEAAESDRVVIFVAHYDSALNSPGAADAMTPVAAMLEAMRVHASSQNLANNIYFLFTDGEEIGALGALAFIRDHPELGERIDMLVNLEAQGNSGGLILFETTPEPSAMLNVWRRAAVRPIGFSLGQPVYEQLNTFTDFNFFLRYNWRGVNLAIIEGGRHYHTPGDNFANLDRNTAHHFLTTAMGLANYAAANPLNIPESSHSAVFFPLLPGNMVIMSHLAAYILSMLACAAALVYIIFKRRSVILMILTALTILATIFLHEASYLFWLPLIIITSSCFLEKWPIARRGAQILTVFVALLLWTPLIFAVGALYMIW
ncbi:MAG: M20/M25/M40 family metallo-hydrolase [Clostridiales bacterium]|jgi:hypothetical protein|nr:M20/M25/M40 family metallo-hydrolase [Clostridiales bacterium]